MSVSWNLITSHTTCFAPWNSFHWTCLLCFQPLHSHSSLFMSRLETLRKLCGKVLMMCLPSYYTEEECKHLGADERRRIRRKGRLGMRRVKWNLCWLVSHMAGVDVLKLCGNRLDLYMLLCETETPCLWTHGYAQVWVLIFEVDATWCHFTLCARVGFLQTSKSVTLCESA